MQVVPLDVIHTDVCMYVCIRIGPRVPPPRDTYYGTSTSAQLTRLSGLGSCRAAYSGSLDDVYGARVLGVITVGLVVGGWWRVLMSSSVPCPLPVPLCVPYLSLHPMSHPALICMSAHAHAHAAYVCGCVPWH